MAEAPENAVPGPANNPPSPKRYPIVFFQFPYTPLDLCVWFNELMIVVLINQPEITMQLCATVKKWDTSQHYDWNVIREIQALLEFSEELKMGFNLLLGDVDLSKKCKVDPVLGKKVQKRLRILELANPDALISVIEATREYLTRTMEEEAIVSGCYGRVLYSLMNFRKFIGVNPQNFPNDEFQQYFEDIKVYHKRHSDVILLLLNALRDFQTGSEYEFLHRIAGILNSDPKRMHELFQFRRYLLNLNDLAAAAANYNV